MKIKTENQTYEITDIRKQTTTYFEAYYNDYLIIIEKEAKWRQSQLPPFIETEACKSLS